MADKNMKICIIGGHGKVALLLHPLLVEGGHEVSALIRNQDHAEEVDETGAQSVVADVETMDTEALAAQFAGFDAVIWSAGAGGGNPDRTYAVDRDAAIRAIDAAKHGISVMTLFTSPNTRLWPQSMNVKNSDTPAEKRLL